jgi:hypothetical protein
MSGVVFQVYSFAAPQIKKNEKNISDFLNKGYNVPRYQYNIITTPRIKNSISEDLGVLPADQSYAIFCFTENNPKSDIIINNNDSAQETKEKLLSIHLDELDLTNNNNNNKIQYDKSIKHPNSINLQFPKENFNNSCLGMICIKPHINNKSYEITGFVSFYPTIGTQLMQQCELFIKEWLNGEKIWIIAIHEHNLRRMYENWGYSFIEQVLVPLAQDGVIESKHLENDIGASQDFHLDVLVKRI